MKKSENTGQKKKYRELRSNIIPVFVMALLVLLWQAAVDLSESSPLFCPAR